MDARFLTVLSGVVLASFAQSTPLVRLFGVNANIAIAAVFFAAFFSRSFAQYAFAVFLSFAASVISIGVSSDAAYMTLVFLCGYPVRRATSWKTWLSYPVSLLIATFLIYGLIDAHFLAAHIGIVFQEGAYTALFGLLLYLFISRPDESSQRHTF